MDCCPKPSTKFWYKDKTLIVIAILTALMALSYSLPILAAFREAFFMYFQKVWWVLLAGFVLSGVIEYYVPREYISHLLAKSHKKTIFYSVVLGFFSQVCCHGVMALAIQLHKKGASTPAVMSFILASPWANLSLTFLLVGFFGIMKGIYIILSAIFVAISTGFIYQFLESKNLVEKNRHSLVIDESFSVGKDFEQRRSKYQFSYSQALQDLRGIYQGAAAMADTILWWILIGIGLASLAGAYIPTHIFRDYMGPTALCMAATLLMATILEVCSEGTAPLAFEIFRQTKALGNSLIFLMAGVVTDYTEIGLTWQNIGKKAALWLPLVAIPQILILGWIANRIF